jgi:SagB-type dehydrogenase family enzyme
MTPSIKLPKPRLEGSYTLESVLQKRRSIRRYRTAALSLVEIAQLLWAAQGISDRRGLRTAPSAGALYPLETYVVATNVSQLEPGVHKYDCRNHTLQMVLDKNASEALYQAGLSQGALRRAAAVFVLTAVYSRMTLKYSRRGIRYVDMEAGHAAQNLCLQAVALNLGSVVIGAFHDEKVKRIVAPDSDEQPLYLIPVGRV